MNDATSSEPPQKADTVSPTAPLTPQQFHRAEQLLTREGVCAMAMGSLAGGPFLVAFALALGATNAQIGFLATIALLSQLMQIPGLMWVNVWPHRKWIAGLSAGISRLAWVPMAFIPLFVVRGGVGLLLMGFLIAAMTGAALGPAWNSLLRDIVPRNAFNSLLARRQGFGMALALILTLAGGYFVDAWKDRFPDSTVFAYSMLIVLGVGLGMISTAAMIRSPEPPMKREQGTSLYRQLRNPLQDANFRRLLGFIGLWSFAVNMAGPFFVIYMLKRIGISFKLVTVLTVVSQVSYLVFLRVWGRAADRFSSKSVLSVSGTLFLLAILAWTFTTMPERHMLTVPLLFAIHALSGMALAGVNLGSSSIGLKLAPDAAVHNYMTVFALVASGLGAIGPAVGGLLADLFAARELALSLSWTDPARELSVYAVNIKAYDFVFLTAFMVGLAALRRLTAVREEGEMPRGMVVQELVDQVVLPFRSISSIEGLRGRLMAPVAVLVRGVKRRQSK